VLIPILEEIVGWNSTRIRALFESQGLLLQEWDKVRTDSLRISNAAHASSAVAEVDIQ
jgi:hypothetical protein